MKKSFLKHLIVYLLCLSALLSLASCQGVLNTGILPGDDGQDDATTEKEDDTVVPGGMGEMDDDPTNDFVVTLKADGEPYYPRIDNMYVYWNDGHSMHYALVDEDGVARIDGLDGDYRVTLSEVPNEYTYDPNGYMATNDNRSITLNLYSLNRLTGKGTSVYAPLQFTKAGVYSADIKSPDHALYFCYAPEGSGTYSIESWVDITEDNVNPYVEVYRGSFAWVDTKNVNVIDDGGPVGSYTSNFVYTVQIADQNISSGGQAVYTFALRAESKNNQYPITVTFAVKRNGGFELETPGGHIKETVIPKFDFDSFDVSLHEYDNTYEIKTPDYRLDASTRVFDDNLVKLWKKSDGGDDFYHMYDTVKYASTDGYGPILYAYITEPFRFLDLAFIDLDNAPALVGPRITLAGKDYKHFIEGYTRLSARDYINGASYYCVNTCPCHVAEDPDTGWACPPTCTKCRPECRHCPAELIGNEGYQSIANSDGLVPVTEELKQFLADFAFERQFFYDGIGSLEDDGYQAAGQSGWLFACAYYEQK